ncbi:MAG: protein-export chaperone SecB [Agarilytica sp.]
MTDENAQGGTSEEQANQPQFALQRIYIKDLSFESPLPITNRPQGKPALAQDLHTKIDKIGENNYEVTLHLTITVKQEEQTLFLIEVHQAGIFFVSGLPEGQLKHVLSSTCPSILFPYARETIDSLATRGGFQPLMLPPINFDAVYAKSQAEAQKAAGEKPGAGEVH